MTDDKRPYLGKLDDDNGGGGNEGGTKTDGIAKITVGSDRLLLSDSQKSVCWQNGLANIKEYHYNGCEERRFLSFLILLAPIIIT